MLNYQRVYSHHFMAIFVAILQMEMHNLAAVNAAIAAIDISAGELNSSNGAMQLELPSFPW